jgi:hypothetical protein
VAGTAGTKACELRGFLSLDHIAGEHAGVEIKCQRTQGEQVSSADLGRLLAGDLVRRILQLQR